MLSRNLDTKWFSSFQLHGLLVSFKFDMEFIVLQHSLVFFRYGICYSNVYRLLMYLVGLVVGFGFTFVIFMVGITFFIGEIVFD